MKINWKENPYKFWLGFTGGNKKEALELTNKLFEIRHYETV